MLLLTFNSIIGTLLFITVVVSDSQLGCMKGSTHKTNTHIELKNCSNTLTTKQKIKSGVDNITKIDVEIRFQHPNSNRDVKYCIIYQYVSDDKDTDGKADFMCDWDFMCEKPKMHPELNIGVEYQGNLGNLYCCNTTGCNDRRKLLDIARRPVITCLWGVVKDDQEQPNDTRRCPGTYCSRSTDRSAPRSPASIKYDCDVQQLCSEYRIRDNQCKNVSVDGVLQELCCCSSFGCNTPSLGKGQPPSTPDNSAAELPSTPLAPMPDGSPVYHHNTWGFLGGIAAALVLGALLFAVVAIVIKKYKQQQNIEETFTYNQLTADLAESPERDTNDERMILG